jgi:hypothetical protein
MMPQNKINSVAVKVQVFDGNSTVIPPIETGKVFWESNITLFQ